MEDQNGIRLITIELAIGFIAQGDRSKFDAAFKHQFIGWLGKGKILGFNYGCIHFLASEYLNMASRLLSARRRTSSSITTRSRSKGFLRALKISCRVLDFIYLHMVQEPTNFLSGNSDC